MENFEDIKAIWHSEKEAFIPEPEEINKNIKRQQNKLSQRVFMSILGLLLCTFAMVLSIYFSPHSWVKTLGGSIIILSIIYAISFKYDTWQRKKYQQTLSNLEYLRQLQKEKEHDFSKFPYKYAIVLVGDFVGTCLYFYPIFLKGNLILGYAAITSFFLLAWFIYRPYRKRKYWKKNEKLIKQIQTLKNQIE